MPLISVVISTYNTPEYLEKVLWSYTVQTETNFEIIIADDGSDNRTAQLLNFFKYNTKLQIKHVWHEDKGFRKTVILNKAILACAADYILMTDGDCVVRNDMLFVHLNNRKQGCFLSGGNFKLPEVTTKAVTKQVILSQQCFTKNWLLANGVSSRGKLFKLTCNGVLEKLLNKFSPTKATWDGNNASGWKKDILAVNGFDERMHFGGEDREFGERLINYGVKAIQLRYSTKGLHLFHTRNYVHDNLIKHNNEIRELTRKHNIYKTAYGIIKAD